MLQYVLCILLQALSTCAVRWLENIHDAGRVEKGSFVAHSEKKTGKGRVQVLISYMMKSTRLVFTGKGVLPLDNHDYFSYLDHIAFIYTNICVQEAFLEIYYNDETQETSLALLLTGGFRSPPPPVFRVPLPNVWR